MPASLARSSSTAWVASSAILVPADATGIEYGKNEEKMGWKSQPTRLISFDGVRVPVGNLLG